MEDQSNYGFEFDLSLEPDEEYTTMDDAPGDLGVFLPNTEGRTEFLPPDPDRSPHIDNAVHQDAPEYPLRPAIDRTRELFGQMGPHRTTLLNVLDQARAPITVDQLDRIQKNLSDRKFSVYTTANLCAMLEIAGALEQVTDQGDPYPSHVPEPSRKVIDGIGYYVPTTPQRIWWRTTAAGIKMLGECDTTEKLKKLLDTESEFVSIYKRVLVLAESNQGVVMSELSAAIDKNPLIAEPRRYFVQHFVEGLERCRALVWIDGSWHITDTGSEGLALLADIVDDYIAPESTDASGMLSTETQGINW